MYDRIFGGGVTADKAVDYGREACDQHHLHGGVADDVSFNHIAPLIEIAHWGYLVGTHIGSRLSSHQRSGAIAQLST